MSDAPKNGNGGNPSITGAARDVGKELIGALPAQFLMLLLINLVFIGIVFWHENAAMVMRAEAINKILDRCLAH